MGPLRARAEKDEGAASPERVREELGGKRNPGWREIVNESVCAPPKRWPNPLRLTADASEKGGAVGKTADVAFFDDEHVQLRG